PLAMELRSHSPKHSWLYNLIAKRFGHRAAMIFERVRSRRISERLRERQRQSVNRSEQRRQVTQTPHAKGRSRNRSLNGQCTPNLNSSRCLLGGFLRRFHDSRRWRIESHLLRHRSRVLIAQMTIDLHGQRAAIFVSKPTADCWNVNARLNASRSKEMTQVVMSDALHPDNIGRAVHRPLTLLHAHYTIVRSGRRISGAELFQKHSHVRYQRNDSHFARLAVFQSGFRVPAQNDLSALKVHISPRDVPSLRS